tara:strand:+ start:169 stop:609 length:441 start_codon:yes stop_codon:yes gene_type:complete
MENEIMEPNMVIFHKIGWKELSLYDNKPPIIPFPKGITIYNKYKKHLQKIDNIFEYLLNKLFLNNDFFVIQNADFPYYLSEYIIHKIIWFNPKYYSKNIDYDFVNKILKRKYKKYIVFENKTQNRSVKSIIHYHFFILEYNIIYLD